MAEEIIYDKAWKIGNYRRLNESAVKGQTVCAGSSLMEMFPVEKLAAECGSGLTVYNRGIGGFVTAELIEVLDVCILDLAPRRLFINIGTNDLSDSRIPLSAIMDNYDYILTTVEKALPGIEIFLMAYYPVNYDAAAEEMKPCLLVRNNEKIAAANAAAERLAQRHKQHYIDISGSLKDAQGNLKAEYTIEGMHITEQGYRAIFPDFMKYAAMPYKEN